jgi:hypothetical protein
LSALLEHSIGLPVAVGSLVGSCPVGSHLVEGYQASVTTLLAASLTAATAVAEVAAVGVWTAVGEAVGAMTVAGVAVGLWIVEVAVGNQTAVGVVWTVGR